MVIDFNNNFNIIKSETLKSGQTRYFVFKEDIVDILSYLKNVPECDFDVLKSVACAQIQNNFEISYLLYSSKSLEYLIISTIIPVDLPEVASVSHVYKSANWDEREIYDLFGINFIDHPNLKRILMPQVWLGHPLRKDYQNNDERLRWNYE